MHRSMNIIDLMFSFGFSCDKLLRGLLGSIMVFTLEILYQSIHIILKKIYIYFSGFKNTTRSYIVFFMNKETKFLKWLGGKNRMINDIFNLFPPEMNNYYEPFLGGGSILIELLKRVRSGKIIVNGNIYANDALFMSGIHPKTYACDIKDDKLDELLENIKLILREGIKNRGSSIDRYKDLYGKPGNHQNHFRVYGKKNQLCTQCGINNILYEKIQGRGTYYCEICQKS